MSTMSKALARTFAAFAAAVAVFALGMALAYAPAAAYAETTHDITITEPSGQVDTHSYDAYQVFAGTYDTESKQLQGITWGSGVDGVALLTALQSDPTIGSLFAGATDAPTAAAAMAKITDQSAEAEALAKVVGANLTDTKASSSNGTVTVSGDGYYFIKDVSEELTSDTYSKYILQVVGDTAVTAKDTTTTSHKFVKETNDSTGAVSEWQKVADYDMGDQVPFQLVGTVASDYADYSTYYFAFNDTYDKTQFGSPQNVKVYVDGVEVDAGAYKLETTDGGFDLVIDNLKQTAAHAGSTVSVEYTAELLPTASIGSAGNVNASHITFSNDSNQLGHKGKTPDETVIVFTYQTVVNKVNEAGQNLDGAGFTLYKKAADGTYAAVGDEQKTGHQFTFKGLDAGDYKLVETTVPAGYNKMADVEFAITSTLDNTNKALTALSGDVTTGKATFAGQVSDGSVTTTVENQSGSILPSTGGAGIAGMLVVGGIIVIAAAAGLVIRRRSAARK